MQEWLLNLLTANTVAVISTVGISLWWFIHRSFSHDAQIKNLGDKIDHVEKNLESKIDHLADKMDTYIKHLDEKMDAYIKHTDEKIDRQDNEAKERITRLEKYFDVIMQTQIKKNEEQLKMEF